MATAIFYASSTGNTKEAAEKIAKNLGIKDIFDIGDTDISKVNEYSKLIFGVSTWGEGDLQDDWDESLGDFKTLNLQGKTIAIFGLGDQEQYNDNYVDGMGILYQAIVAGGGNVVGFWSVNDYEFDESIAQIDDQFVGLALDEDNQPELSDDRIKEWCNQIRNEII